jgi:hypothetical protein
MTNNKIALAAFTIKATLLLKIAMPIGTHKAQISLRQPRIFSLKATVLPFLTNVVVSFH